MKAFIQKIDQVSDTQSVSIVQVTHGANELIADNFGAVVSASCNREFLPVSNLHDGHALGIRNLVNLLNKSLHCLLLNVLTIEISISRVSQ
jgi:hypothetical protein